MKLPLSWLSDFVTFPKNISTEKIAEAFVKVGFEVEGIIEPGSRIKGPIKVATVLSIKELTEHKKPIRYVGLDTGERKTRFVICGATNFKVGDKVVVAIPGAILPGDFRISARETYGHLSDGMICSGRELGISEDHAGIIVLDSSNKAKNGSDALTALGADDPIFDIAVNPDRGYAMSIRGAARELAMALNLKFTDIDRKAIIGKIQRMKKPGKTVPVAILDKKAADLIYLRTLSEFNPLSKTPDWMARRIAQAGMRSISLAVDVTNYVMLEIGQPLHAFDAAKIEGRLQVQRAGKHKSLTTLDGEKRKLTSEDILIADSKKPLALGGTMGGLESEVSEKTTRLAIEAAHFISESIARQSRSHQLSTEASRRFERGVDPALAELASARAVELLLKYGGASYHGFSTQGSLPPNKKVVIRPEQVSILIGANYTPTEITKALSGIGCQIKRSTKLWTVTPPTWRPDIGHISDIAEEVARYYGYDRIPNTLPTPPKASQQKSGISFLSARRRAISLAMAARGFVEVQNFPFTNREEMNLFAFTGDRAKAFVISNPISDEFPLLRTHLSPGLLKSAVRNLSRGEKSVALFETGLIFRNLRELAPKKRISTLKKPTADEIHSIYEGVPYQSLHLAAVVAGEIENSGWWGNGRIACWEDAVEITSTLLRDLVSEFEIASVDLAPWHPGRCAEFRVAGKPVAHAGEVHPRITSELGLPSRTIYFGIVLDGISERRNVSAKPVNTFPATIQDISMYVDSSIPAASVAAALREGGGELLEDVELFDRYQKEGERQVSLAFTLRFRASGRTLTNEEVSELRERAGASASQKCGAKIRA